MGTLKHNRAPIFDTRKHWYRPHRRLQPKFAPTFHRLVGNDHVEGVVWIGQIGEFSSCVATVELSEGSLCHVDAFVNRPDLFTVISDARPRAAANIQDAHSWLNQR